VQAAEPTDVGFVGTDAKFTASLIDFSPFGLAVKSSREVKMGAIFRTGMRIGADYFRAAAIVRRKTASMFAVEFLSMTPIDRESMRRLYLRLQRTADQSPPTETPH
jgi:hypothetical protein